MALGTKEDGHFTEVVVGKEEELIIFKGLYSPNFRVRSSKVWTKILSNHDDILQAIARVTLHSREC